jgi:hypothetical protein
LLKYFSVFENDILDLDLGGFNDFKNDACSARFFIYVCRIFDGGFLAAIALIFFENILLVFEKLVLIQRLTDL